MGRHAVLKIAGDEQTASVPYQLDSRAGAVLVRNVEQKGGVRLAAKYLPASRIQGLTRRRLAFESPEVRPSLRPVHPHDVHTDRIGPPPSPGHAC